MKSNPSRLFWAVFSLVVFLSLAGPPIFAKTPAQLVELTENFEREIARQMEPLERKYLGALEGIQRAYAQSGNLDGAVVIKSEIDRVKGEATDAEGELQTTEELSKLQTSYHQAIERATTPIIARYQTSLVQLQERFTTDNDLESAVLIRDRLGEMEGSTNLEIVEATTSGGSFEETASLKDWLQTREFHWRGNTADVVIQFDGSNAHVIANGTEIMERRIDFEDDQTFSFDWSADDTNTFTISNNRRSFTRHMSKTDSAMQGEIRSR